MKGKVAMMNGAVSKWTRGGWLAAGILAIATGPLQAEQDTINNGTDPTLLTPTAVVQYKYTELRSDDSLNLFEALYTVPVGAKKRVSLSFKVPYASGVVDTGFGLGDMSLTFTHVASLNQKRGLVYTAEVIFDTADRIELGTGQTVLKASGFYARFLPSGAIFAPALVHQFNLSNNQNRNDVNNTTLDLYYVPKLANPKVFMTFDPAITSDWERSDVYASLTITFGRLLGKAFGGDSQIFIKPQVLGGGDRPIDWSFQIGYKVLGF